MPLRTRLPSAGSLFALIAVLCGLGAAYLAGRMLTAAQHLVPVVVAKRSVGPLQLLAATDLRATRLPAAAIPSGAIARLAEAAGAYTRVGLVSGQIIQRAALADPHDPAAYSLALTQADARETPAGVPLRAVPLYVDAAHGFPLLQPGDHVDLLVATNQPGGALVETIARYAPVEALIPSGTQSTSLAPDRPTTGATAGVAVLDLTPGQAEQLAMGEILGKVTVTLDPLSGIEAQPVPPLTQEQWSGQVVGARAGTGR